MVAYSFQARFREPILAGTKRQTIRADRKRHARPSEALQLYTGMRTRQCAIIGHAVCKAVQPVRLDFDRDRVEFPAMVAAIILAAELDTFAERDGFHDWLDMRAFWRKTHPDVTVFSGVLVAWGDFDEARAVTRRDAMGRG